MSLLSMKPFPLLCKIYISCYEFHSSFFPSGICHVFGSGSAFSFKKNETTTARFPSGAIGMNAEGGRASSTCPIKLLFNELVLFTVLVFLF